MLGPHEPAGGHYVIMLNTYALRVVLGFAGAAIVFLGLNVGFGGIQTLGWQGGTPDFISINDAAAFGVRDNHIRFIGGVWLGVGLLMLAGAFCLAQLRTVLIALTAMIFVGGLARFSAGDTSLLLSSAILPSFVLELVLFPLLGFWIYKVVPRAA
jgi:Domain of unknown function (DUF4345)